MSILVNTPTGNIGRFLVDRLLEAGEKVTVIHRDRAKVASLEKRGVQVIEGSADDPEVLRRAFGGVEAVFWLTPPAIRPDQPEWAQGLARAAAAAAKAAGVKRAVVQSSMGAQNGPANGPVGVLLGVERAWQEALPDVVLLRAGFFMENYLRDVETIVRDGALYSAIPAGKAVPVVATRDIAEKAVRYLTDRSWHGHHSVGVHGPEDLAGTRVAEILGEALGRPLRYVEVTLDQARQGMLQAGFPDFAADAYTALYRGVVEGTMETAEPRTANTTTPTTLATFADEELKPAVEKAGVPSVR